MSDQLADIVGTCTGSYILYLPAEKVKQIEEALRAASLAGDRWLKIQEESQRITTPRVLNSYYIG